MFKEICCKKRNKTPTLLNLFSLHVLEWETVFSKSKAKGSSEFVLYYFFLSDNDRWKPALVIGTCVLFIQVFFSIELIRKSLENLLSDFKIPRLVSHNE